MKLEKAAEHQSAFRNLFNLYVNELSSYAPFLGQAINEDGIYQNPKPLETYFHEKNVEAYVIYEEGRAVGFVTVEKTEHDGKEWNVLSEIYLIPSVRKHGIATGIISDLLRRDAPLMTHILKGDTPAIDFFEHLFKENGISYKKEERDPIAWNYWIG